MKFTAFAIVLTTWATMAVATEEPSAPSIREKCADDIKKLCSDAKLGVNQCLQENEAKLSQACKDARNALRRPLERPNSARPN